MVYCGPYCEFRPFLPAGRSCLIPPSHFCIFPPKKQILGDSSTISGDPKRKHELSNIKCLPGYSIFIAHRFLRHKTYYYSHQNFISLSMFFYKINIFRLIEFWVLNCVRLKKSKYKKATHGYSSKMNFEARFVIM